MANSNNGQRLKLRGCADETRGLCAEGGGRSRKCGRDRREAPTPTTPRLHTLILPSCPPSCGPSLPYTALIPWLVAHMETIKVTNTVVNKILRGSHSHNSAAPRSDPPIPSSLPNSALIPQLVAHMVAFISIHLVFTDNVKISRGCGHRTHSINKQSAFRVYQKSDIKS